MSRKRPRPEDDILEALLEDERAAFVARLREHGQLDDEQSWPALV
jgi:hypothetical protein